MTEKNLENVSHEEAVSALKCTSDRVVLVVAKTDAPLAPMLGVQQQQQTPLLSQSAVNLTTHHSHQPPSPNPALGNTPLLRDWNTDRDRFFRFSLFRSASGRQWRVRSHRDTRRPSSLHSTGR